MYDFDHPEENKRHISDTEPKLRNKSARNYNNRPEENVGGE